MGKKTKTAIGITLIIFGMILAAANPFQIPLTTELSFSPAIFLTAIGAILLVEEIFAKPSHSK